MPLINVKLIEDVFTPEQKGQIVERLTDAMVSIEGENMRAVTWSSSKRCTAATGASAATRSIPRTSGLWPPGRPADRATRRQAYMACRRSSRDL
jgi:hypothetical protein